MNFSDRDGTVSHGCLERSGAQGQSKSVTEIRVANLRDLVDELSFQQIVNVYYQSLYRFAFALTGQENDAWDLTQQTFYRYATKGHQLQDRSKVKSWLFTTLRREFLNARRHQCRFPHVEMETAAHELPPVPPTAELRVDSGAVVDALMQIDEPYRSPLTLFYLEDHSYREIAKVLDVPEGTVMSRIARGKALLRQRLAAQRNDGTSTARSERT